MKSIPKFVISLTLCFGAGFIGSIFTKMSVNTWYLSLLKPHLSPPNWIFAPVWNFIYLLLAIAFYKIGTSEFLEEQKRARQIFCVQLFLDVVWSAVFFGLRSPYLGFLVIILLLVTIVWTIVYFRRISKQTSYLLYPYLAWVCFASYLNYSLWILNH